MKSNHFRRLTQRSAEDSTLVFFRAGLSRRIIAQGVPSTPQQLKGVHTLRPITYDRQIPMTDTTYDRHMTDLCPCDRILPVHWANLHAERESYPRWVCRWVHAWLMCCCPNLWFEQQPCKACPREQGLCHSSIGCKLMLRSWRAAYEAGVLGRVSHRIKYCQCYTKQVATWDSLR